MFSSVISSFYYEQTSLPMALSAGFWGREMSWLEDVVLVVCIYHLCALHFQLLLSIESKLDFYVAKLRLKGCTKRMWTTICYLSG